MAFSKPVASVKVQASPLRTSLQFSSERKTRFVTGKGVKSLVYSSKRNSVFALCLEEMAVFEYNATNFSVKQTLRFIPSPAQGFDYESDSIITSWAEKPVEGLLTHDQSVLWISLHNAGGVVAWPLEKSIEEFHDNKVAILNQQDTIRLPFFETGKTPKVLTATPTNDYLLVSNWHENTLTILDIAGNFPQNWQAIRNIPAPKTPRGIALSTSGVLAVGGMLTGEVWLYNLPGGSLIHKIKGFEHPRHLQFIGNELYMSLSSPEKLVRYSLKEKDIKQIATTSDDPRTFAFSPDQQWIALACYGSDSIELVDRNKLLKMHSYASEGSPVGVAIVPTASEDTFEVWSCNYRFATIVVESVKVSAN